MLDERDLQAIAGLIDAKLEAQEARINANMETMESRINANMETMESRINANMEAMESRINASTDAKIDDLRREMHILVEADINPKLQALAEGHELLLQTLAPKDRVEALEEEVSFLRQVVKSISQDVAALKKAQ